MRQLVWDLGPNRTNLGQLSPHVELSAQLSPSTLNMAGDSSLNFLSSLGVNLSPGDRKNGGVCSGVAVIAAVKVTNRSCLFYLETEPEQPRLA